MARPSAALVTSGLLLASVMIPCGILLLGCAAPPTPTQPPLVSVSDAPPAPRPAASRSPEPRAIRCTITEATLDSVVLLRLKPGGLEVAELVGAAARLPLHDQPQVVELERGGVLLRTPYDAEERPLHFRSALNLGGVVTPRAASRVVWLKPTARGEQVRYTLGPILNQAVIEDEVPCEQLALNTADYSLGALASELVSAPGARKLELHQPVDVRPSPELAPTLHLDISAGVEVLALEQRQGMTRIRMDTDTEVVRGWVSSSALSPLSGGERYRPSVISPASRHMVARARLQHMVCPRDVRLFVDVQEQTQSVPDGAGAPGAPRAEVGLLSADTPFEELESFREGANAGFVRVGLWQPWIIAVSTARFMLRASDVERCEQR